MCAAKLGMQCTGCEARDAKHGDAKHRDAKHGDAKRWMQRTVCKTLHAKHCVQSTGCKALHAKHRKNCVLNCRVIGSCYMIYSHAVTVTSCKLVSSIHSSDWLCLPEPCMLSERREAARGHTSTHSCITKQHTHYSDSAKPALYMGVYMLLVQGTIQQ